MTISIGAIVWPADKAAAIRLYLEFLLKVFEALGIKYSGFINDPIRLVKNFLEGEVSEDERSAAASLWWDYLDGRGEIQDFQSHDALMARLAICLLSVKEEDVHELGENLSWFLEVLGFIGADLDKPIDMMSTYFTFSPRP